MKFYNLGHKTFETDFSTRQTDNRLGKDIYHNVLKRMSHPKDTFIYVHKCQTYQYQCLR